MSLSLLLLCTAATAMVAFGSSAALGLALLLVRRRLDRLAPAAQARLLLFATLLPSVASVAVMTAALAPSFGWIFDHCAPPFDGHAHPHICTEHHQAALPAVTVWALASLLVLRVLWNLGRLGRAAVTGVVTRRLLSRVASAGGPSGAQILPFEEPQAFVVGLLRPLLFVTRGLLGGEHHEHLDAVLAHEQAHLRRRDSLRRLIAFLALPFHLPAIANWLERRLGQSHEMAADAEAAVVVRSPERVAQALVRLARATRPPPQEALAFGNSNVEARVTALLDSRPRSNRPHTGSLVVVALVGVLTVAASAGAVHHGIEMLLGILGG